MIDITQSLMRAVRKDPEMSKRVNEEIFHILTTSDSESDEENECEMTASGLQETRAARMITTTTGVRTRVSAAKASPFEKQCRRSPHTR